MSTESRDQHDRITQEVYQEFKDDLCRDVINISKPGRDVATAYGVGTETLRSWLLKYRYETGSAEGTRA